MTLRPWQAYALDRALEYDKDGLIWASVIITVGRQSGKSWLSRAVCMWRLHNAELFNEPQTIIHVANKRETAMEVIRPAMQWAVETYGNKAARWGNTMAGINLPTGDRWIIHAANESAGVGYSAGMVFADEAWKIERRVIEDSLAPTMAERNQPQLWLVSTAGDSSSELMLTARARAIDNLDTPTSELLLEWSAPPDADPDLVSTWQWGSPEWSEKREKFLRQQWERIDPGAFKREYLNQWIVKDNHWMGSGVWDTCEDPELVLDVNQHWAVACESDFDGTSHAVAIAWVTGENLIAVKVTTHRTIKDVDDRLAEIRAINPDLHVAITPSYIDRLTSHSDAIVGQREAQIATQVMLDAFNRCTIRHDGDPALLDQFTRSTISKRSGGWVLSSVAGSGGVYAARAVMFALAQITKQPKPRPMIYSRSATRR
jgi:phage terminase large subunit-like protein